MACRTVCTAARTSLLTIGLAAGGVAAQDVKSSREVDLGASLAGQLLVPLEGKSGNVIQVGAPGGEVHLLDAKTGRELAVTPTTRDGRYRFEALPPGGYVVCWEWQGVTEGCEEPIEIVRDSRFLEPHLIADIRTVDRADLADWIAEVLENLRRGRLESCENGDDQPRYLSRRRNAGPVDGNESAASVAARERSIANGYYARVDRARTRETLGAWWQTNGFDPVTGAAPPGTSGQAAASAAYLNHNDLGFGRNMHCLKRDASHVACWVANHGAADQDPANADLAAAGTDPDATVTMEFSPLDEPLSLIDWRLPVGVDVETIRPREAKAVSIEELIATGMSAADIARKDFSLLPDAYFFQRFTRPTVKFYVYKPDAPGQSHAEFPRATSADLDGCGEKQVPGLCLNCHGGNVLPSLGNRFSTTGRPSTTPWTTAEALAVGKASFREFDTESFRYPGGRTSTKPAEDVAMEELNRIVQATDPVRAIDEMIDAWYAGRGGAGIDAGYVPPSWKTFDRSTGADGKTTYLDTVAKGCRTCHVALEGGLEFNDQNHLSLYGRSLPYYLCDDTQSMPHAKITALNFTAAQRTQLLKHFGQTCP